MKRQIKCSKCGHVGPEDDFPKGRDFLQEFFIAACPKCDNSQSPGDASMRMFGGERPFIHVRETEPSIKGPEVCDAVSAVIHRANEAS